LEGLQEPNWDTRREVVRALVKKVEVDDQEVRVVYRVSPSPFERGPKQGNSQHCLGRGYRICCDIGLSQASMSRFMSGKTGLAMDTLDRLAEYLGLSVAVRKPEAKK
jgi:hypothetical protein